MGRRQNSSKSFGVIAAISVIGGVVGTSLVARGGIKFQKKVLKKFKILLVVVKLGIGVTVLMAIRQMKSVY
jgi:hypothetical protein